MAVSAEIIDFRAFRERRLASVVPVPAQTPMVWVPMWVFWPVWLAPTMPVDHSHLAG